MIFCGGFIFGFLGFRKPKKPNLKLKDFLKIIKSIFARDILWL